MYSDTVSEHANDDCIDIDRFDTSFEKSFALGLVQCAKNLEFNELQRQHPRLIRLQW